MGDKSFHTYETVSSIIYYRGNILSAEEKNNLITLLSQPSLPASPYPSVRLKVNYDKSFIELIFEAKYDHVDGNYIKPENYSSTESGSSDLVIKIVYFNKYMTSETVIDTLDKLGLRPATMKELLTLGSLYPFLQIDTNILALGSTFVDGYNISRTACLNSLNGNRILCTAPGVEWSERYGFAAVQK